MKKVIDTNILLEYPEIILSEDCIIPSTVISELENIKTSGTKSEEIRFKARRATRLLSENEDKYAAFVVTTDTYKIVEDHGLPIDNDNLIIACCKQLETVEDNIVFVSNDLCARLIAKDIFEVEVESYKFEKVKEIYKGYKEVILSDEEMAYFYSNLNDNRFDCLTNEYVVIKNQDGEVVEKRKWDGDKYDLISYKQINNDFTGKIKPRNLEQELAFDMLQDKDETIKVLTGGYGTGKDYLMVSTALDLIKNHKFDKIMWVRNNIEVKNSKPIGFLPSGMKDKLLPFAMVMADHLGGVDGLELLITQNKIEIEHLGFIRGRDIKNTIIMCSESENMTKEHIQLLIGRVGEGSALWLNGDYRQTDDYVFENNNGLIKVIDKLKGNRKFGFVQLKTTERSETARLADLLD
jgi:Predicted ATPase related to phosphate starvation-inducible protein PhoH